MTVHNHFPALPALVIGICLLSSGCNRADAPPYDSLRSQLISTVFASLVAGDDAKALRQLQRLQDAVPQHPFPELALAHLRRREFVQAVNSLLAAGQLEAAATRVSGARANPELAAVVPALRSVVEALQALRQYRQAAPFASAQSMQAALTELAEHSEVLMAAVEFQQWWQDQHDQLAARRQRELELAAAALAQQLQTAVCQGEPRQTELFAQLAALMPKHPIVVADAAIRGDDPFARKDLARQSSQAPEWHRALELAVCRHWSELPAATRQAAAALLASQPPQSMAGRLVRARAAAGAGDISSALAGLRTLAPDLQLDDALLAEFLQRLVLPPEQYRARPWRTPLPSVVDFLDRLTQLREQP